MFWLELLIVSVLANVFGAAVFTLVKAYLSNIVYPEEEIYKLDRREYWEHRKKIDIYIYGESRIEQAISTLSLAVFIVPLVIIKRLPSATAGAWREFWEVLLE